MVENILSIKAVKEIPTEYTDGRAWCGSTDWVLSCEPKGRWFDSQSGYMPGLRVGERQPHIDVSLHFSFPFPLSKNK